MSGHVLVVRLDALGDVLLTGPAVRALAATADRLTLLAGPAGAAAARLLPGVDEVWTWACPWILGEPPAVEPDDVQALVARMRAADVDRAVVVTSRHQSPLPTALLLRLAGVPWVGAISDDYPGSLLDLRHRVPDDLHEVDRCLDLALACGGRPVPAGPSRPGRTATGSALALRQEAIAAPPIAGLDVVVHPGTSVPARAWPAEHHRALVGLLARAGLRVGVTGGPDERALTAFVGGEHGVDLGGRTEVASLAGLLASAGALVAGNTGPAHLATAVGTPVVSLFAPTVPAARWRPHGVHLLLGDQAAPCRDTRARACPVPGHPCLAGVRPETVAAAVVELVEAA